jgi:hypothetical protein
MNEHKDLDYDAVNIIKSSKDLIPPRVDSYLFISHIPVQHLRIIVMYILLFHLL